MHKKMRWLTLITTVTIVTLLYTIYTCYSSKHHQILSEYRKFDQNLQRHANLYMPAFLGEG